MLGYHACNHMFKKIVMQPLKDQPLLGYWANGAGKSTLLKAIGLIQSSGEILIDGGPQKKYYRKSYVEQKSQIDFTFPITIRRCVALGENKLKKSLQHLTKGLEKGRCSH